MNLEFEGLTRVEKIFTSIFGILLVLATGVLIINFLSENERKLVNETPIMEKEEYEVENKIVTKSSASNLIEEESNESSTTTYENLGSTINTNTSKTSIETTTQSTDKEIGGISNEEASWSFKDTLVTEATSEDELIIDKNVILEDGSEVEAQLTIRKLVDGTYMIVDISEGTIKLTSGTYKYYYTYAGITREKTLIVNDQQNISDVELLSINDSTETIQENKDLNETLNNSTVSIKEDTINLNISKTIDTELELPIVITLSNSINQGSIISIDNENIRTSIDNDNWYQELSNNQIILWLDLNEFASSSTITLSINEINYQFILNIKYENKNEIIAVNDVVQNDT